MAGSGTRSGASFGFAVLDADTGQVEYTDAAEVAVVVAQPDRKVILGGYFDAFAGASRTGLVRISASAPYALDTPWNPPFPLPYAYSYSSRFGGAVVNATHLFLALEGYPFGVSSFDVFFKETKNT